MSHRSLVAVVFLLPRYTTGQRRPLRHGAANLHRARSTDHPRRRSDDVCVLQGRGVETFVIRPGFEGKVDEFGMLIPFPQRTGHSQGAGSPLPRTCKPPSIRPRWLLICGHNPLDGSSSKQTRPALRRRPTALPVDWRFRAFKDRVVVVKQEAVGMYEVGSAGSRQRQGAQALVGRARLQVSQGQWTNPATNTSNRGWCFVAVKTKVGQKDGVDPKPAQRNVNSKLPTRQHVRRQRARHGLPL